MSCSLVNPLISCHEQDETSGRPASMVGVKLQCRLTEKRLNTHLWSFWYYIRFECTHKPVSMEVFKEVLGCCQSICLHKKHPASLSLISSHTASGSDLTHRDVTAALCHFCSFFTRGQCALGYGCWNNGGFWFFCCCFFFNLITLQLLSSPDVTYIPSVVLTFDQTG